MKVGDVQGRLDCDLKDKNIQQKGKRVDDKGGDMDVDIEKERNRMQM